MTDEELFATLAVRKQMIRDNVVKSWYTSFMDQEPRITKSIAEPDTVKVGPKGYVHGWIKVGADSMAAGHRSDDPDSAFKRQKMKMDSGGFSVSKPIPGQIGRDKVGTVSRKYGDSRWHALVITSKTGSKTGGDWKTADIGSHPSKKVAVEAIARAHEAMVNSA